MRRRRTGLSRSLALLASWSPPRLLSCPGGACEDGHADEVELVTGPDNCPGRPDLPSAFLPPGDSPHPSAMPSRPIRNWRMAGS